MDEQTQSEQNDNQQADAVALNNLDDTSGEVQAPDAELIASDEKLGMILDIPVTIAMELGRTSISVRDLLQLTQGSVIELDRIAGEPLDILVNGTLIARGEVVVINDKFGIRLTEVVSAAERIQKLS